MKKLRVYAEWKDFVFPDRGQLVSEESDLIKLADG
jgi:hypothetical protein